MLKLVSAILLPLDSALLFYIRYHHYYYITAHIDCQFFVITGSYIVFFIIFIRISLIMRDWRVLGNANKQAPHDKADSCNHEDDDSKKHLQLQLPKVQTSTSPTILEPQIYICTNSCFTIKPRSAAIARLETACVYSRSTHSSLLLRQKPPKGHSLVVWNEKVSQRPGHFIASVIILRRDKGRSIRRTRKSAPPLAQSSLRIVENAYKYDP